MPQTRASSKPNTQDNSESDQESEHVNTIVPASGNNSSTSTINACLADMLAQIQNLQAEVARSNQLLQQNERVRRVEPTATFSANGGDNDSGISLASALTQLSQTLTEPRQENTKPLYDLPEFDGRPEDWPMFKEAFLMTTEGHHYNERQNMLRLQKAIKGTARETVECLLIHSSNVTRVIETLGDRFGRPEQLVKSQIARLKNVPPIADNHIEQIVPFATKVQNLASFLEAAGCEHHLCNPTLMEELELKLPMQRRLDWARYAITIKPRATISHFSAWLQELSRVVSAVSFNHNEQTHTRGTVRSRFFHTDEARGKQSGCKICFMQHNITKCNEFLSAHLNQRWQLVRQMKLCFNCLEGGHRGNNCRQRHECDVRNCTLKLHKLLHGQQQNSGNFSGASQQTQCVQWQSSQQGGSQPVQQGQQPAVQQGYGNEQGIQQNNQRGWNQQSHQDQHVFTSSMPSPTKSKLLFKILPVKLYSTGKEVSCYAFFDEGSSVSLMNDSLAERLGVQGEKESLTLQWFGNKTVTEASQRISLKISGDWTGCEIFALNNIRTVRDLKLRMQTLEMNELDAKYRHIKKLPIQTYQSAVLELLIGLDNAHLGVARRVAADGKKGPVIIQTRLGWLVYGSGDKNDNIINHAFFARDGHEDELEVLVKKFIVDESVGVRTVDAPMEPRDVARAKKILDETTVRIGNRFEVGLLWKDEDVDLPESRDAAVKRLLGLEKKLDRDETYRLEYMRIMKDYEAKDFSRKLSNNEASAEGRRSWYLPHFGIYNPNKPGKLRLVFDAAAEVRGVSLNSLLLSGPDLGQPLTMILMKFRQKPVAVCADIVQMFHQVQVRAEDQLAQRFLWRDNQNGPIQEYVMAVMTFGATCSPCSAQHVKNCNAMEFEAQFPEATKAIVHNHYVDDFVHCFSDEEEAVRISREVKCILSQGGFELNRFISNSALVNEQLGKGDVEDAMMNLDRDDTMCFQKVLGMHWDIQRDSLKFELSFGKVDQTLLNGERRPTKREVLSTTMSVFDPFGIASEYSLMAKLLLQLIWRERVGWDEQITDKANEIWNRWLGLLREVETLSVPRYYGGAFSSAPVELHVFADASELAYAAVAYWKIPGEAQLAFVVGKTKCAPVKLTSIPRLELQSAVMATRLRQLIIQNHDINPTRIVMWSDSKTVLSWIKSDHRRYKPYVAHRINEILDGSSVDDWRWVASAQNPADFGTRIVNGRRDSFWINGPKFLLEDESK